MAPLMGRNMCNTCEKLEADIQRYRKLRLAGLDQLTVDRIEALILELQKRKEEVLH